MKQPDSPEAPQKEQSKPDRTMILKKRWSFPVGEYITAIEWLSDGSAVAIAPGTGGILVVDSTDGRVRARLRGHEPGNCALAAGSGLLATSGQDGLACLWNPETHELITELQAAESGREWCENAKFSPNGELLATSAGRTLRIWNRIGECVFETSSHCATIAALTWRPDGAGVATGSYQGVQLFRCKNRVWESSPYEKLIWKGSIISLQWSPNGRYVAGGSQENTVQFWRLPHSPGQELFMSGYARKVRELAWDESSRFLATSGGDLVTVWDVSGKGPAGTMPKELEGHSAHVTQLVFQHRGGLLASGGDDGRVFLCNLAQKQSWQIEPAQSAPITVLRWSPNDTLLSVGSADGEVSVWDVKERTRVEAC